jgi:hypothetical protein
MTDIDDARSALAAKQLAQHNLAKASACPLWRHAAFGLLYAGLVISPVLEMRERVAVLAIVVMSIGLIIHSDRQRTGMFINGYRRGATRWVTLAILAVELPLYVLSCWWALTLDQTTGPLLLAIPAFAAATLGSIWWQRVFVRELGAS